MKERRCVITATRIASKKNHSRVFNRCGLSHFHFGDPRRVRLPELSLVEQCVTSRGIAHPVIIKLPELQIAELQPAKKGHVIVFPQIDAVMPSIVGETAVIPSAKIHNLGVILDSHPTMEPQISIIRRKAFYHLGRIKK